MRKTVNSYYFYMFFLSFQAASFFPAAFQKVHLMERGSMGSGLEKILRKYDGLITGPADLLADKPPSPLFYILANLLRPQLDPDPEAVTPKSVAWRRKAHFIIQKLGPMFLGSPQTIENRNFLRDPDADPVLPDPGVSLPEEPVIFAANHAFRDDSLASILAAKRHTYISLASVPQLFNTFDGFTSWFNGPVLINRKVKKSRNTFIPKSVRVLRYGADLLIFPEGVWNKSPNALVLNLWPGVYRITCETGAKIVPVVHYIRDYTDKLKDNPIHTVIDDPIRIDNLSESAALELIREILATWHYLMMEVYGKATRKEALAGALTSSEAWEKQLAARITTADRYDKEIELKADFRNRTQVLPPHGIFFGLSPISKTSAQPMSGW